MKDSWWSDKTKAVVAKKKWSQESEYFMEHDPIFNFLYSMTMKKRGKVEARFVNTEKKAYWQIEEGMDRRTKRWTGAYT